MDEEDKPMASIEEIIFTFNKAKIESREFSEGEKNEFYEQIAVHIDLKQDIIMKPSKAYHAPFYVCGSKDAMSGFHTFNGYKPKTMLFYSNYCELELLRIAYLLDALGEGANWVYENTKQRIKSNCFGRFCPTGECFEISIAALRFVATIFPEETEWIRMYMKNITETILAGNKRIPYQTKLYFAQTLCEIDTAESRKYLLMLVQCIQHLKNCITRSNPKYQGINGQIMENCMAQVGASQ